MIQYYLKLAWRNFTSSKLFSFLNLMGLSIAIAICIPLFLFVCKQYSFDSMYAQKEHIYRVNLNTHGDHQETWASVPNALAPALMKDVPEVAYAARMYKNGAPSSLRVGNDNYKEDLLFWADPELFKIFDLQFVSGHATQPFEDNNAVVISQSEAKRLFGKSNPLGRPIMVDNATQLTVTGVYKDFADNSSINAAMIGNFKGSRGSRRIAWDNASFETFCLLKEGAQTATVNRKMAGLLKRYIKDEEDRWFSLALQPLSGIHLHSAHISDTYLSQVGDIKMVRQLSLLGLLIVLIACINYMNLATARSEKRSREVGINKTLGATRAQMVFRFYADTALTVFLAVIVGFVLSFGSLYLFNTISGNHLMVKELLSWQAMAFLLMIWGVVSLLAGIYPALLLSGSSALQLMQKRFSVGGADKILRKGLVVLQFSCSIILIIGIAVIYQQMRFIGNKNLGFTPNGVLMINIGGVQNGQHLESLANALKQIPAVQQVAQLQSPPGFGTSTRSLTKEGATSDASVYTCNADANVVPALGLHMLAGKNLPEHLAKTDSMVYVLVNKKVVDYLGMTPETAIGKKVEAQLGDNAYIVGVISDFNYMSLRRPIEPFIYYTANDAPEPRYAMIVKMRTEHLVQTMDKVQAAFIKNVPAVAFDYAFLDTHIQSLYDAEKVMQKTVLLFSSLAIFVSCLGLFGLSAFMAEQKTKEIGIRKVLGASSFSISKMLSLDFLKLVLISIIIGVPPAIYLVQKWLSHFEYRIKVSWIVVALAAVGALLIALLTVSYQSIKAAKANPLQSIKTE